MSPFKWVVSGVTTVLVALIAAATVVLTSNDDNRTELEMLRITNGRPVEIRRDSKRSRTIGVELPVRSSKGIVPSTEDSAKQ